MDIEARRARDGWIALRCKLGEPEGFADLVAELERPLLYFVTKILGDADRALDVLQEVWLKVFRTVSGLQDPASLRPWLYRVARGTALNRLRTETSRERAEEGYVSSAVVAAEEGGFAPEEAEALHEALDELDRHHREVLVLHFLEDLSIEEIGAVVGVPAGTVKSRIHHAKKALRGILERRSHD